MKTSAHSAWIKIVSPGDTVIDATCGNGHDTLILAKLLQGKGQLIAYDVQKEAILSTQKKIDASLTEEERGVITLKHASHMTFDEMEARLIVYNLGYLPGSDKKVTTMTETSLQSVQSALQIVIPQGFISITCYPGHPEGEKEEAALLQFCQTLSPHLWDVSFQKWINREKAPSLLLIGRK